MALANTTTVVAWSRDQAATAYAELRLDDSCATVLMLERLSVREKPEPPPPGHWSAWDGLALFCALFSFYALLGRGTFFTSDEGGIYNTALALLQHRTLAIGPGENVHRGRDNRYYACREILPSLASMPPCFAGMCFESLARPSRPPVAETSNPNHGWNWPIFFTVTFLGPFLVAGTLLMVHRFLLREGVDRGQALWITLITGLATPLAVYSKTLFPQVFEAALLMLAFTAAARWGETGRPRDAFTAGLANGLALMTRAAFLPIVGWFALFLVFAGENDGRRRVRALVLFMVPVVLGALVTGGVNWLRWGSPLDFGYHHEHEAFSTPWKVGLYGLLASPGKGLFVYAPVLLVPVLCLPTLWRRGSAETALLAGVSLLYIGIYSRWYDWGGGLSWGPRFLIPLIAPWMALCGRAFLAPDEAWPRHLLYVLAPLGLFVQWFGVAVHPYWMAVRHSDAFSVEHSQLAEVMAAWRQTGSDDLWLWSARASALPSFPALALGLGLVVFVACAALWRRSDDTGERWTIQGLFVLTAVLLIGVIC